MRAETKSNNSALSDLSALDIVHRFYPGQIVLDTSQLGNLLGLHPQYVRNRISTGRFPIRPLTLGRNYVFDVRDVAEFIDASRLTREARAQEQKELTRRKRGRPSKADLIERAEIYRNDNK